MYSLSQVRRGIRAGIRSPNLFARELNRLYHRRLYGRDYNTGGVDVFAEDWDTLVVLDACRFDMFARQHTLPGELQARYSRASHTSEFLRANFAGRDLQDTVYVTASPQLHRRRDEVRPNLHAEVHVWREDGWDDEYKTVLPGTMTRYALRAAADYPNKRLVVHYIQPHYPFIGSDLELDEARLHTDGEGADIWGRLMRGDARLDPEVVWRAYSKNLDAVLPHVEELLDELAGKTVVTSDHGNMVGEPSSPIPIREWGHPPGIYTKELVTVPWLVTSSGERRKIVAEPSKEGVEDVEEGVVRDRLEDLGYVG